MIERCPRCWNVVETVALTSNPPIYKKICRNCGEIKTNANKENVNLILN